MALTPHVEDKNREDVLKNIDKLRKKGTAQSADKLKELHNIDVGEKTKIVKSSK